MHAVGALLCTSDFGLLFTSGPRLAPVPRFTPEISLVRCIGAGKADPQARREAEAGPQALHAGLPSRGSSPAEGGGWEWSGQAQMRGGEA